MLRLCRLGTLLLCIFWSWAGTAGAAPAAPLVKMTNASVIETKYGGWYAEIAQTVVNGTVVQDGAASSFDDCAATCSSLKNCEALNFCNVQGGCSSGAAGTPLRYGACEMLQLPAAYDGVGVPVKLQEGSGSGAIVGMAGARIMSIKPTEVPPGYSLFFAQSPLPEFDLPCNDTGTSPCVSSESPPVLLDQCDAWPACKAVVVGSNATGAFSLLAGGNPSTEMDPKNALLNPWAYTLIKTEALPASYQQAAAGGGGGSGGRGLSAGNIAGIVVGAVVLAASLAFGAFALCRRRRRRAAMPAAPAPSRLSSMPSSSPGDPAALWGKESGADSNEALVARLISQAPSPQWGEVIVQPSRIQFCTKNGRAERLGGGASGTVYRGMLNAATPVALKVFDFEGECSLPTDFIQEAAMMRKLAHPNLLQLVGISVVGGNGVLVMELAAGGDLWKALRADEQRGSARLYGWYNRGRTVALGVANGLLHLHQLNILHLDLKSPNILLSRDSTPKIGDVGFAKMLNHSHVSKLDGRIGTWSWCAPEVLVGGRATHKSDIYSLGILLWEICTGKEPVRGLMAPLSAPQDCPQSIVELQARCVSAEPAERPSAAEVVEALRAALKFSPPAGGAGAAGGAVEGCLAGDGGEGAVGSVDGSSGRAAIDRASDDVVLDMGGASGSDGVASLESGKGEGLSVGSEGAMPSASTLEGPGSPRGAEQYRLHSGATDNSCPGDASTQVQGEQQRQQQQGGSAAKQGVWQGVTVQGQVALPPPSPFGEEKQQQHDSGVAQRGVWQGVAVQGQVGLPLASQFAGTNYQEGEAGAATARGRWQGVRIEGQVAEALRSPFGGSAIQANRGAFEELNLS